MDNLEWIKQNSLVSYFFGEYFISHLPTFGESLKCECGLVTVRFSSLLILKPKSSPAISLLQSNPISTWNRHRRWSRKPLWPAISTPKTSPSFFSKLPTPSIVMSGWNLLTPWFLDFYHHLWNVNSGGSGRNLRAHITRMPKSLSWELPPFFL